MPKSYGPRYLQLQQLIKSFYGLNFLPTLNLDFLLDFFRHLFGTKFSFSQLKRSKKRVIHCLNTIPDLIFNYYISDPHFMALFASHFKKWRVEHQSSTEQFNQIPPIYGDKFQFPVLEKNDSNQNQQLSSLKDHDTNTPSTNQNK